jgi:hypothetical protein
MKDILLEIKNILEENVSELKCVKIGSISSAFFSHLKLPTAVVTPVLNKSHNYPKLDKQDYTVEITIIAEKSSLNQDEDATLDVIRISEDALSVLGTPVNMNLRGACDGKYLEYEIKYTTGKIESKKIFASVAVIKTSYFRHFLRDVQPSGK